MQSELKYLTGFGNYFESEAVENALPKKQNSPQQPPLGLYAEQLSGASFTTSRQHNCHSWLYRILPSVKHQEFKLLDSQKLSISNQIMHFSPMQLRWDPMPYPDKKIDFIDGLIPFAHNGNFAEFTGATIYLYAINQSMQQRYFYNTDGDLLIVPQEGELQLQTEFGIIKIKPSEIAVIPRGIKFKVELLSEKARGYICENYAGHFNLPERGPIGANGLAHERHFQIPVAAFEDIQNHGQLLVKFQGKLWAAEIDHPPLNVVAWHGNYVPYKYDLKKFNTINSVSFDHPDPSIFTVLSAPSEIHGVANIDFVIFPERWMVANETFRPPYFHRNIMSEFMGLIEGVYDAKQNDFAPGGCSLHNCMSAHGPDAQAFVQASNAELKPEYYAGTLAFMFESRYVWKPTEFALQASFRQQDYLDCWRDLPRKFNPSLRE